MSLARRLIAAGFNDLEKGERFLAAPELDGLDQDALFAGLQLAANPDTALQSLVRLIEKHPDLRRLAAAEPDRSEPLYRVLGASEALGEFLIRHPEHLDAFQAPASPEPTAADSWSLRSRIFAPPTRWTTCPRSGPNSRTWPVPRSRPPWPCPGPRRRSSSAPGTWPTSAWP